MQPLAYLQDEGYAEWEIDELMALADFAVMMNTIAAIYDIPPERPFPPSEEVSADDRGSGALEISPL